MKFTRSSAVRAGLAQRARIVLLAADGEANTAIAATADQLSGWLGVKKTTMANKAKAGPRHPAAEPLR